MCVLGATAQISVKSPWSSNVRDECCGGGDVVTGEHDLLPGQMHCNKAHAFVIESPCLAVLLGELFENVLLRSTDHIERQSLAHNRARPIQSRRGSALHNDIKLHLCLARAVASLVLVQHATSCCTHPMRAIFACVGSLHQQQQEPTTLVN